MKKQKDGWFEKSTPFLFSLAAVIFWLLIRFFETKLGNKVYNKLLNMYDKIRK